MSAKKQSAGESDSPRSLIQPDRPRFSQLLLHAALGGVAILVILQCDAYGLQLELIAVLDRFLQIEILNREVVVAVFVGPAHRREIRFAHRMADRVLLREVAVDRLHRAVDQKRCVIRTRGVGGRVAVIFFLLC